MGKITGFLDYPRREDGAEAPRSRIQHFREFHRELPEAARREQGGRCMNCGVPFCQSGCSYDGTVFGCPLHNLIPEWNDMIWRGNWEHALSRLLKNNNFPEFTGRVCPAPCELACTCAVAGKEPVTIRENELGIIEAAFAEGRMQPRPPKLRSGSRVAVVGSGPAGLACADQLNRRGHTVTVFERDDRPGGLLMYGIPSMKLEKSIVQRRVELMAAEGISFRTGADVGRDVGAEELRRDFDAVVLCCGAAKPRDLSVPGREGAGVWFAVDFLTAAARALLDGRDGPSALDRDVVIVGGGDTGNDCVGACIRQGCRSVTQLEMLPKAPERRGEDNPWPEWPRVCKTDYGQEEAIARFGRDPRVYETTVSRLLRDGAGELTGVETVRLGPDRKPLAGTEKALPCQLLLIAAGFLGPQDYVPEAFGLARTPRSTVRTAEGGYAAGVPGVFAAGDMRRGQSLVVWAIREGREAAREVDRYLMGYGR